MLTTMVEDNRLSRDLKPSPELFEMIQAAASSLTGFAQLWESIRKKGNSEGFTDEQLQWLLRPLLQNKLGMSKDKIYYLFHKEEVKERTKGYYTKVTEPYRKKSLIEDKKEPEERSTTERPQDAEQYLGSPEPKQEVEEEDPKDLEIQFLKERVAELEDALKKTQQFKPATQLQGQIETFPPLQEEEVFDWLKKRDDGSGSFWYDSYGIDLFKTRQLPQLKNQGVKVFRRLYFEV